MSGDGGATFLDVHVEHDGPSPVLRLAGELDCNTVGVLRDSVEGFLLQRPRGMTFALESLRFIDSSGLRELIRIDEALRAAGARLSLVAPAGAVSRVLKVMGMEEHFSILA